MQQQENPLPESISPQQMMDRIRLLEAEKRKLESELNQREDLMNNLLTYIQNKPH